jgi:heme oxygenase (biliverdin-producing, ferredoxin)
MTSRDDSVADGRSARALRDRTAEIHRRAERSGIIADIARRGVSREGLALFLRNLLPVYQALEGALEGCRPPDMLAGLRRPQLWRACALARDVEALAGAPWRERLPLTDASVRYAARIAEAARVNRQLLISHAYVRYMGDLSGGQILKRVLAEQLGPTQLGFYEFADIGDVGAFKTEYRAAIDKAMRATPDPEAVLSEAVAAFELNISLSDEVRAFAASRAACVD